MYNCCWQIIMKIKGFRTTKERDLRFVMHFIFFKRSRNSNLKLKKCLSKIDNQRESRTKVKIEHGRKDALFPLDKTPSPRLVFSAAGRSRKKSWVDDVAVFAGPRERRINICMVAKEEGRRRGGRSVGRASLLERYERR